MFQIVVIKTLRWYNMKKEKEETYMNACAIKPTVPYVAKTIPARKPISEESKRITEFINAHDFSFTVDKQTGKLKSTITSKTK